jgi:hypothetical protein
VIAALRASRLDEIDQTPKIAHNEIVINISDKISTHSKLSLEPDERSVPRSIFCLQERQT